MDFGKMKNFQRIFKEFTNDTDFVISCWNINGVYKIGIWDTITGKTEMQSKEYPDRESCIAAAIKLNEQYIFD